MFRRLKKIVYVTLLLLLVSIVFVLYLSTLLTSSRSNNVLTSCLEPRAHCGTLISVNNSDRSGCQVMPVSSISLSNYEENLLLVLIISTPNNAAKRDIIRNTWVESYVVHGKRFPVKFVIGTQNLEAKEKKQLMLEREAFEDLLFLTDHSESYQNLTRKTLRTFMWIDQYFNYSYILKTDDDSFPKLDLIEFELRARTTKRPLYWGKIASRYHPKTSGQWAETQWDLSDTYLPYALGGGYVISKDLVHRIAMNADGFVLYNNEDVSVGAWISPFHFERQHDERFCTKSESCFKHKECKDYILIHHQSIDDTKNSHHLMRTKCVLCE